MDFKISGYNNFYKVKGHLNKKNAYSFKAEFNNIFKEIDSITISVEGVESIDKYGVAAISQLHFEALKQNKKLSIIGYGCKDLYNHFNSNSAA
ncbi:STAS domain-containing protein [Neotamlana laminarinivorans]|uniref:STAS domain-containing protein n=1 Tax=Neotamlana laminarinivorans TaxID=2883124 RepID=A0A9X1I335_9FLAO|nr:STAS domain-containing protein [Tamlana laminarinivorans]MCB4799104.1 hypothetical protein [Tamlana laminarinivorans]